MRSLEDLSEEEVQEIQRGMDAWRENQIRPFKEPREFHGELYEFDSAYAMRKWGGADARAEELQKQGRTVKVVAPHRFRNILRRFLGLRTHQWYIVYKRMEKGSRGKEAANRLDKTYKEFIVMGVVSIWGLAVTIALLIAWGLSG